MVFGLEASDWVAIVLAAAAAIVSGLTFYFGYARNKKSEQIRISRDLWDGIRTQNRFIHQWPLTTKDPHSADSRMELINALESLKDDLDYFVYLMREGEIEAPIIRQYYRRQLRDAKIHFNVKMIETQHSEMQKYTKKVLDLIEEYYLLTGKPDEHKESSS